MKEVKCTKEFPTFVWTDMKEYDGHKAGEVFKVPDKLAELLIKRELALEVKTPLEEQQEEQDSLDKEVGGIQKNIDKIENVLIDLSEIEGNIVGADIKAALKRNEVIG